MEEIIKPEFSRLVSLDKIGLTPLNYHIHAEPEELTGLTQRLKVVCVSAVEGDFIVRKGQYAGSFEVEGTISAQVVQTCVVTLDDVPESLHFPIRLVYRHGIDDLLDSEENDHEVSDEVDYEDLEGVEAIDLGEVATQYLALALNPYPRSPNAPSFNKVNEEEHKRPNPFTVLQKLKKD